MLIPPLTAAVANPGQMILLAGLLAVASLITAIVFAVKIRAWPAGSDEMRRIAAAIRKGAMAFLRTEYVLLLVFVIVLGVVLAIFVDAEGFGNFRHIVQSDQLGAFMAGMNPVTLPAEAGAEAPTKMGGTALCFLVGALCSVLAGFIGMRTEIGRAHV